MARGFSGLLHTAATEPHAAPAVVAAPTYAAAPAAAATAALYSPGKLSRLGFWNPSALLFIVSHARAASTSVAKGPWVANIRFPLTLTVY